MVHPGQLRANYIYYQFLHNVDNITNKTDYVNFLYYELIPYVKSSQGVTANEFKQEQFGEVLTPINLVEEMLDTLPNDVWNNPNIKFLDPCNGVGVFPCVIVKRLMEGLISFEPNDELRYKHIVENMLYVCEIQEKNMLIYDFIFSNKGQYKLNKYLGSFLDEEFNNIFNIKFDIIIQNPPYQETVLHKTHSPRPLYNLFINKCLELSNKYLLSIHPSRYMSGGKNLDNFRKEMFERTDIELIKHFDNSKEIFGKNVDIRGGIQYFLINKQYNGLCKYNDNYVDLLKQDVFIENKYDSILNKIINKNLYNLSSIVNSASYYKIETNDSRLKSLNFNNSLTCYVSMKNGLIKYIDKNELSNKCLGTLNKYKLFMVRAAGKGGMNDKVGFGNSYIGHPMEICNHSYMSIFLDNINEANNLQNYLNTKFANFLLKLRKNTQDIKPQTLKWIPLMNLNIRWDDQMLYKYFELTQEEIKLIENN